jgi:AraC-like DNA-binding protein
MTAADISMKVEASVTTPDCVVQLRQYDWNAEEFVPMREARSAIAMNFHRPSPNDRIRYIFPGTSRIVEAGSWGAVEGGKDYYVSLKPGMKRTVDCAFEESAFRNITGAPPDWFGPDIVDRFRLGRSAIRRALHAIFEELTVPRLARDTSIEGYALVLLSELARLLGGFPERDSHTNRLSSNQMARIREYIEDHLPSGFTIAMIATELGISRRHLGRLFMATEGQTLQSYVEELRIARIREFLLNTNWPLKTIATRVGISSGEYLSEAFTRRLGITPTQYRRQAMCGAPGGADGLNS